jgi:hypothetical protein
MSVSVLLVSIAFPPKRDPESLQVAKYLNFLKHDERIKLEVVTSADPTLFMEPDSTLDHYRKGINGIRTVKIFENRYVNFLLRKINPTWLQLPDSKFSFWWNSRRIRNSFTSEIDILYSRSYPISSTILALKLKKQLNVPWVLHLSDPWAQSSSTHLSPATSLTDTARQWNKKQEKICFELADKIALTSHKTIALYKKAYPHFASKFVYFPNVFDDQLIQANPYDKGERLKFIYNGGFGQARSPEPFLQAIERCWNQQCDQMGDRIQFIFTGEMTRANSAIFDQYKNVTWVKHLGVLPYDEVVKLQRSADILVNIDSNIPDPDHAVFFPSKLLDYMVAQRRIMAVTNRHSTTHDVIQDKLGDCFEFSDIDRMSAYFSFVFGKWNANDVDFFFKSEMSEEFSARNNAKRLGDLLVQLKQK